MPILYVLSGPDIGKTFEVGHGAILGRVTECDVVVRGGSVSRKHARLELEDGDWALLDTGSRNGLRLEGRRVQRIDLSDGLSFELGEVEMRFRREAQGVDAAPTARPAPEPAPEPAGLDGGIEFEDESLFDAPAPADRSPTPAPTPAPSESPAAPKPRAPASPDKRAERMAKAGIRARQVSSEARTTGGRPILQYSKTAQPSGFLTNDLGQYPIWIRVLAALAGLALFAAVFYFAMRATSSLKGRAVDSGNESSVLD